MSELREEEQNLVNGGQTSYVGEYLYRVGDKVTDYWNQENGVGVVTKNVGVCGHGYIDEVYFPYVNQTYNVYEHNLIPA